MSDIKTRGIHHVGLTVSKLEESANFFKQLLGWKEIRRDESYPAIFVSDGQILITLWQTKNESSHVFDKNNNVGLHHLALQVENIEILEQLYETLMEEGIEIEFSPEPLRGGPVRHMMCYEPSGIRVEFICVP